MKTTYTCNNCDEYFEHEGDGIERSDYSVQLVGEWPNDSYDDVLIRWVEDVCPLCGEITKLYNL